MGLTTQTYDILSRIGIGNGSLVYRAVHKTNLRQVALKLLTHNTGFDEEPEFDHRFDIPALLAKVPVMKLITGSHVCQLLDAYEDEDGVVLAYEFASGLSGIEVPYQRRLDAAQALDVASQVISALRSGERQRTPHGDFKASNLVFVDTAESRPYIFILDWGLAAFRSWNHANSLPYLAPERLMGGPISHQSDLFSAGVVLFYLFTGKVLAAGETNQEVLISWSKARPEILAELRPDLPPKLVQWVCSLLALDPVKRPQSAVDAGNALAALSPPPAMIPPESIRPKPMGAAQRAQQAMGSGVVPSPQSGVARPIASGVRPAASGVRTAPSGVQARPSGIAAPVSSTAVRAEPASKASPSPGSKKTGALIMAITLTIATAAAAGAAWWLVRGRGDREPEPAERFAGARTPSPSVTKPAPMPEKRPLPPSVERPAARSSSPKGSGSPASLSPAATLADESFAYTGKTFSNENGGKGWGGPWTGTDVEILAESLSYKDQPGTGGSLLIPSSDKPLAVSRSLGPLSRFQQGEYKDRHWYFAGVLQHSDGTNEPGGELRVSLVGAENVASFRIEDLGQELRITTGGGKSLTLADEGKPMLVVARVQWIKDKEGAYDVKSALLVNPKMSAQGFGKAGPALEDSQRGANLPSDLMLKLEKSPGKARSLVDEIRYGRHWSNTVVRSGTPAAIEAGGAE